MKYSKAIKLANKYSKAYYLGNEIVSDSEFDGLMEKIKLFEKTHTPSKDSPTQKVGSDLSKGFKKILHNVPMLSLAKVLSLDELKDWLNEMKAKFPNAKYSVEYKMDGCGLDLTYKNGKLVQALTRGNGVKGDLITENAMQVLGVPHTIKTKGDIQFRGEVVMPKFEFEKALKKGEQLKNCRNTASGALKRHSPKEVANRKLKFYGYTMIQGGLISQTKDIKLLQSEGVFTPYIKTTNDIKEIIKICDDFSDKRKKLDFDIDGIVIKLNLKSNWKKCGSTFVAPKYAIAYKFPNDVVTPVLKDVKWQVGKSGAITPVAIYEPQQLCGTTVERATLHNMDNINSLGICIGDEVEVIKSGEIIPQVRSLYKKGIKRIKIKAPSVCPICGAKTKMIGAKLYCTNKECSSKTIGTLQCWCAKQNMDIRGVSTNTLISLNKCGLVKTIPDLYFLTKKKLLGVEGIKSKSANNILEAIESSKTKGLSKVISGLNISDIGNTISEELAGKFPSLKALANASYDELVEIETLGEVKSKNIENFFKHNKKLVSDLYDIDGLVLSQKKAIKKSNKLNGKKFCITGTLSVSRDKFQAIIKENGGIPVSAITNSTDYLISGVGGGSKINKADKLGIEVINEGQFNKMISK